MTHSRSLKDKRRVVRSVRDKVKARFDVRLSEVGGHDTWQRLELGFAAVGIDAEKLDTLFERIVRFIEEDADAELVADNRESIYYGEDSDVALAGLAAEMGESDDTGVTQ